MDYDSIRQAIYEKIGVLVHPLTNDGVPKLCESLGLADASSEAVSQMQSIGVAFGDGRREFEEKYAAHASGKHGYVSDALARTKDADLIAVAEQLLKLTGVCTHRERNALQNLIWPASAPISKRVRHLIARALEIDCLFLDAKKFDELIESLFVLDDDQLPSMEQMRRDSLRMRIQQHVHRNMGDWSVEQLFDELGGFEVSDQRFLRLLLGLVSPEVQPEVERQSEVVASINGALVDSGLELVQTRERDGYPVYEAISTFSEVQNRPKNLIFASSVKPDLRLSDAISNEVEIVTNADRVLVFHEPITSDGLNWTDLQNWWKRKQNIDDDDEAKNSLYRRLRSSLPKESPPQLLLFNEYHAVFGARIPRLPALIPEVWFHWDPKTAKQRGTDALFRSRMDFLMLLPAGVRVVLEVDGKHHYSTDGVPDAKRYAEMVKADRELKLDGYHVFRFGGAELKKDTAKQLVGDFFQSLFQQFGVRA